MITTPVLRPQGTLYGQGSVRGTVRFLTQTPVIGETSLTASGDLWTTEDGGMSQRFVGVRNLSLSDKSALRIAGMVENTGGWIDAPTANREDINDGKLFQIRATGLFKLTDSLSVTGMAQVHRNDVGSLANGENGDGDLILPAFAPNAVQPAKNDHDLYSPTADWDRLQSSRRVIVRAADGQSHGEWRCAGPAERSSRFRLGQVRA